jgi:hypothetical protein
MPDWAWTDAILRRSKGKIMKLTVKFSDRANLNHVEADSAYDAVVRAAGRRIIHARADAESMDGSYVIYNVAVATSRSRAGSTPFRNVMAIVRVAPLE